MNNTRFSASNKIPDVYRPSESERLQAARNNEKLRGIQEKRRSQNLPKNFDYEEFRGKKENYSNEENNNVKYNFDKVEKPIPKFENNKNDENHSDVNVNISKVRNVSPFYDKSKVTLKQQYHEEEDEEGDDPLSYPPRVMTPKSLLESRGISSSGYGYDSSEMAFKPEQVQWNASDNLKQGTLRNRRQFSGARTLRKNLGDPLPLPYLKNEESNEKPKYDNLRVLTKGELENKSEYFNNKFKQLLSQDKINIAKRLRQLSRTVKHEENVPVYRQPPKNEDNQYSANNIRHSDSNPENTHKLSRDSSLRYVSNEDSKELDSGNSDTNLKTTIVVDELVLLELQRTLDMNGEKLDIMINLLKDYRPGSSRKTMATIGPFQIQALIRTICFIMILLVLLYMFYVSYGVYKFSPYM